MSDNPEWFAAKRYGYGASFPISWQGWALTIGFIAVVIGLGIALKGHPLQAIAAMVPVVLIFMLLCARTTKGGWRWRWGDTDER